MGLSKNTNFLFILIMLFYLSSCSRHPLKGFEGNPYTQGCEIHGQFGTLNIYNLSDYLINIEAEVQSKIKLPKKAKVVLLTEIIDGGDGLHDLKVIFFNESEILPVKITYVFVDRKEHTKELRIGDISKKKHVEILKIYERIKNYGEWNIFINCLSLTTEQSVIFYIKENEVYHYLAQFENFSFTKNPSIGIDDEIMYLIRVLEEI